MWKLTEKSLYCLNSLFKLKLYKKPEISTKINDTLGSANRTIIIINNLFYAKVKIYSYLR